MKANLFYYILFLHLFLLVYSLVQKWNLENSSIDLLASSESITVTEFEQTKDNLNVKLNKIISKENGSITYKTRLIVYQDDDLKFNGTVDFDKIDSFYYFNDQIRICPKGKFHPITIFGNSIQTISISGFVENGDWELKCYLHTQNIQYFLVFYLMNNNPRVFYQNSQDTTLMWEYTEFHNGIYDIKINTQPIDENNEYDGIFISRDGEYILLNGARFNFRDEIYKNLLSRKNILNSNTFTRGCFENENANFYFLAYSTTSDFVCAFCNLYDNTNIFDVSQYIINTTSISPLEFFDDVEIQEIKFIYNYKYAYYSIYNPLYNKNYHGIIDIKKNLVVFNTDEDIITFTPYTNISMLAITKTNAYEVCVIKKDGKCIDSNDCTGSNHEFILDIEGNKCSNDCNSENNFCNESCDKSIYIEINNSCFLCKDYYPDKPYKLINGSYCISKKDIPEGSEIYNSILFLLRCKDGYVF